jgi:hypothetical protein
MSSTARKSLFPRARTEAALEWFRLESPPTEPEPLDDSFSKFQHWRKRLPEEVRQLRFSVSLWALIDVRKDACQQVAAQLRKMAQFLNVQAGEIKETVDLKSQLSSAIAHETSKRNRKGARR